MDWIVAVDDDVKNLEMAGHILSKHDMRVTGLKSGRALVEFLKTNRPDLILLDIMMPDLDGFETLQIVHERTEPAKRVPVIFLTADESEEAETRGLQLGAMDFIRKPFVPHVLAMRVRHTIDLTRLQRNLAAEVERKTRENAQQKLHFWTTFFARNVEGKSLENVKKSQSWATFFSNLDEAVERQTRENARLHLHVARALAEAIDERDAFGGHSGRVALYAREIGRRLGYPQERRDALYLMALLHDVGKIGLPDAVLNRRGDDLSDEERALLRSHTAAGAQILKKIDEMPSLSIGARWHHERYDGGGWPDGLAGEDIPEEARIIAVANAYDAMTDRDSLPPEAVRAALEQGRGSLFDPAVADVMLEMLAEGKGAQFDLYTELMLKSEGADQA